MTEAVDFLSILKTYLPGNNWKVSHQQGGRHMLVSNDLAAGYSASRVDFVECAKSAILKCYEISDKSIPNCLKEFAIDFLPTEDLFFLERAKESALAIKVAAEKAAMEERSAALAVIAEKKKDRAAQKKARAEESAELAAIHKAMASESYARDVIAGVAALRKLREEEFAAWKLKGEQKRERMALKKALKKSRDAEMVQRRLDWAEARSFGQRRHNLGGRKGGSGVIAGEIVIHSAWPASAGDAGAESLYFCGGESSTRLCEDEPSTIGRVARAFERAHKTWTPFGGFLGDDFDYQFTDARNGVSFFAHDRSGHSGRVPCFA